MLIGNYSVLLKSPAKFLAGLTVSDNRSNFNTPGRARNILTAMGFSKVVTIPNGYKTGYNWQIAQVDGGMSTYELISSTGSISFANLAGGLNGVSDITGSGDIVDAAILWLGILGSTITGTASSNIDINGLIEIGTSIVGDSTLSSDLLAAINAQADVSGTSSISLADIIAALLLSADILGTSDSNADLAGGVNVTSDLSGTSDTTIDITAIWRMLGGLSGSSGVNSSIKGQGNFLAALTGTSAVTGSNDTTIGDMSALIDNNAGELTTEGIAHAVWSSLVEGNLSYQDVVQILLAIAAGKTTVVDLGSGQAVVTFRNMNDTLDRVTATMDHSDRVTVTTQQD